MEVHTAMPTEAILEAELPIIDPHHHLWDRPSSLLGQRAVLRRSLSIDKARRPHYASAVSGKVIETIRDADDRTN